MRDRFPHQAGLSGTSAIWGAVRGAVSVLMALIAFLIIPQKAVGADGQFAPLSVTLQPRLLIGSLPSWDTGTNVSPVVSLENDTVDIPVPPLSLQEEIGCFALTVVFQDNGDGGPVVQWSAPSGERTLLSAGLGETGVNLGMNSRTLLLPQSLSLDGGKLSISFTGRFSRLVSITLRPAKELGVAALVSAGEEFEPALIDNQYHVFSTEDVSGQDVKPTAGDRSDGYVVHADLSAAPLRLDLPGSDGVTEFVVPLPSNPVGTLLHAEIGGLDPESWIEASVNGESRGVLVPMTPALEDPSVIIGPSGRLSVAGWVSASLFLPARLWKAGDNSLVLSLHRSQGDSGSPVYLRNVRCDLLFPSSMPTTDSVETSKGTNAPAGNDTLSTGSQYGNPSPALFHAPAPGSLSANSIQTH
jgi:hypothetical protein